MRNDEFINGMGRATEDVKLKLLQNMNNVCLLAQRESKQECPIDEGSLQASITSEIRVTDRKITGVIGSNLDYAPFVHQGTGIYAKNGDGRPTPWSYVDERTGERIYTRGQRPNPFLENAILTKVKPRYVEMLKEGL